MPGRIFIPILGGSFLTRKILAPPLFGPNGVRERGHDFRSEIDADVLAAPARNLSNREEAKMRRLLDLLFASASLVEAHAQGTAKGTAGTDRKSEASLSDAFHYTISWVFTTRSPAGVSLCWQSPYPYLSE